MSLFSRQPRMHPALSVALRYQRPQDPAPRVVASGRGALAERIVEIAREHQIPVHQDDQLASLLGDVEVNETIPEELFEAVARILAFIYRVDQHQTVAP